MPLVGQLDGGPARIRCINCFGASAPQREHVTPFHAIARALVERHDLVLAGVQCFPVDRHDLPAHRCLRRVGGVIAELWRRNGGQTVADAGFLLQRGQRERGWDDVSLSFGGAACFARADVLGRADIAGFIAQQFIRGGVEKGLGFAEDSVLTLRFAQVTTHIRRIAAAHQHTALLGGNNSGGGFQLVGIKDHRFVQKRLDQVERYRRDGAVVQPLAAHLGRQLHRAPVAGLPKAQSGTAAGFVQVQHLAWINQVRVADLLEVHAPQLGPAPRAFQKHLGNVPQRVARLDRVRVGCIRGQFGKRNTGLRYLLRRAALLRGHGPGGGRRWYRRQHSCQCHTRPGEAHPLAGVKIVSVATGHVGQSQCVPASKAGAVGLLGQTRQIDSASAKILIHFHRFCP